MARTSRKTPADAPAEMPMSPQALELYNVGGYRRLSVEDERHRDRHTLQNQEDIIRDYVAIHPDLRLMEIYTDDGKSGTNFNRPGFQRLMDDVRNGKINCIIVKDLSRFARDFREAGHYIEQIFPFLGVRFISINDHFDTAYPNPDTEGISIPTTNLINELYARDISRKVNGSLEILRHEGKYLGALAPYGYNKSPEDKHKLVIDPIAAVVVRNIFTWLLAGWSDYQIVRLLNQKGIPAPGRYRFEQGILKSKKAENSLWRRTKIKKIVLNPVYMGDTVQGRYKRSYFSDNGPTPENEWVVVRDTHEAIVDRETFEKVQGLLIERKIKAAGEKSNLPATENILLGLVYCGDCGCTMDRRYHRISKDGQLHYRFVCRIHKDIPTSICTVKNISEREVLNAVFVTIQTQIALAANLRKIITEICNSKVSQERRSNMDKGIVLLRQKITRNENLKRGLFEHYMDAILTESEYLFAKEQYEQEAITLGDQLDELLRQKKHLTENLSHRNKWISAFLKYEHAELSRAMLVELVERIDVHDGKRLSITLKFRDEYQMLVDFLTAQEAAGETVTV